MQGICTLFRYPLAELAHQIEHLWPDVCLGVYKLADCRNAALGIWGGKAHCQQVDGCLQLG